MKRKADTTTGVVIASGSYDATYEPKSSKLSDNSKVDPDGVFDFDTAVALPVPGKLGAKGSAAANRRESTRAIRKPKKDLSEDVPQHAKHKKGKLTEQMKFANQIVKELFAKKHAVSSVVLVSYSSIIIT